MICDVDRLAICQSCFHLLGKNGCSREAANELKACFGALRRTAHVGDDLRGNIAVAPTTAERPSTSGRMSAPLDTRLRAEALRGTRRGLPSGIPFRLMAIPSAPFRGFCIGATLYLFVS